MSRTASLGLLEVLERDGRVRRALPVDAWPIAIGRAFDNDLVLDDPHVAAHHAVIERTENGVLRLVPLTSVNGVGWGRRRLRAGQSVAVGPAGGPFSVGATRLRLRLPGEALAPERRLAGAPRHAATVGIALALWVWLLALHALRLDPGSRPSDWLLPVVGAPAMLLLWCVLWALASKLFQHRFDFWPHLGVAVRGGLAVQVVAFALPWLAVLSGWAGPSRIAGGAATAAAVATLFAHARIVLPQQQRALAVVAIAGFALGSAILLTLNQQRHERWFGELYVSLLPPPALRWAEPVAREAFLRESAALRAELEQQVRDARDEGREDAVDEE